MQLKHAAASGVRWTALSLLVVSVTQLFRLIVLGNILEPSSFGLLAMMLVATGFMELVSRLGLSESIIQHHEPTHIELSSLYWLNIIMGCLMYAIFILLIPLFAFIFSTPELIELFPWLGLTLLVVPWGAQFHAMLQKKLCFKSIAIIEITSVVIGATVSIALAINGFVVWSLVWGVISQCFVLTILFVLVGWNHRMFPGLHFKYDAIKPYLSFGFHRMGGMLLNYFNVRADQFVVGVLLGPQALGYYSMAFNLVLRPISQINPMLTKIAFPVLTKVRDDKIKLRRGYFKLLDLLSSINSPLLIGVALVAPVMVPALLGEKWLPTVPLIQILSLYALLRSMGNAGGSLVLASGRADLSLYWNLILFCIIPVAVFFGANINGLLGVSWTLLTLQIILVIGWYRYGVQRLLGRCFRGYIKSIMIPMVLTLPMVVILIAVKSVMPRISVITQLVIEVLIGAIIYLGFYFWLRKNFMIEQFRLFFNLK
jgi:lipopolysaccharide exporter